MAEPSKDARDAEQRSQRGGLADALRRYVDAMVGATEVSRERAERIIGDLARRGETRTRDIQKAAREMAERSARNQRDLVRLIQKEIRRQIDTLGLATRDDVGKLQERVSSLEDAPRSEERPARRRSTSKRSPAKPPARTPGARRKSSGPKKTDT